MQYAATICLKSVSRSAQSDDRDDDEAVRRRGWAAHACCDMVPLVALRRMITAGATLSERSENDALAAVDAIIAERKEFMLPASVASRLRTVVGETTGYVRSYVPAGAPREMRSARAQARKIVAGIFRSARLVATDDMTLDDSGFYKFADSALVHDTLISESARAVARKSGADWLVPQIVYAVRAISGSSATTYGAPHARYMLCAPGIVAYPVRPVTRDVTRLISSLSKFEHPVPALAPPPRDLKAGFPNYGDVSAILGRDIVLGDERTDRAISKCSRVTACVPLHADTQQTARQLAEDLVGSRSSLLAAKFFISAVTENVGTLTIDMFFSYQ
jgi:hypothetical protein